MPQTETRENAAGLEALATAHFKRKFTKAEQNLLENAPLGLLADWGVPGDPADPGNEPSKAATWVPDRAIAADLIRWLCVAAEAKKRVDPDGIWVQGAKITGSLYLRFVVVPFPIMLLNCALTDEAVLYQVELPRLDLSGSWTTSINAEGAVIKGDVFLRYGFHAHGEVRLVGAQIGGDLECTRGTFNNPGGSALTARGVNVKEGLYLGGGFSANGEVNLIGAQVGESLECPGGTFNNPGGNALIAQRAEVRGSIFLNVDSKKRGFAAAGTVDLVGAKIGGDLDLTGGDLTKAELYLAGASTASISDDWIDDGTKPGCWPAKGRLHLDGFVYHRIDTGSRNPEVRLKWLELQPEKPFAAQPYLHLAEVLRAHGDDDGATRVLVAMEDRRLAASDYSSPLDMAWSRAEGLLLKETIGYGYQPLRAFPWILGLTGLSWILYRRSYLAGGMVPAERDACASYKTLRKVPEHYPKFSPAIYSLENSLPLVKLGQADNWRPDPSPAEARPPLKGWVKRFLRFTSSPQFLRRFLWVQILLGWLLATLFLAGVSGVIRKD